jgi:peptidoglycan/LPS O-acetylase OafA/YrhL
MYMSLALLIVGAGWRTWLAHLLFVGNYTGSLIKDWTSHCWSLCVEVHFYLAIGLLVLILRRRGLLLLPLAALGVTAGRVLMGWPVSVLTLGRVDEILAGGCVALVHTDALWGGLKRLIVRIPWLVWMALFVCSCHPRLYWANYLRPYLGAVTVAHTLWRPGLLNRPLRSRPAKYLAAISYSLYLYHGFGRAGWFGEGSKATLYLMKRPLGVALAFGLAHISTFYYEKYWINWGKTLSRRMERTPT